MWILYNRSNDTYVASIEPLRWATTRNRAIRCSDEDVNRFLNIGGPTVNATQVESA